MLASAQPPQQGTDTPTLILADSAAGKRTHAPQQAVGGADGGRVGAVLLTPAQTAVLDHDIEWFGQLAAQAEARYEREHCFTALGDRDRWLLAQREAMARKAEGTIA